LTDKKLPKFIAIIPFIWSIAAVIPISRGIYEDYGLILSGVLGTVLVFIRDKQNKNVAVEDTSKQHNNDR